MRKWPLSEQPRERLRQHGAARLTIAELLAIVWGTGSRGEHALAMAQRLLAEFGGLHELLQSGAEQLQAQPGVGPARAAQLVALRELYARLLELELAEPGKLQGERACMQDSRTVARFAQLRLGQAEQEIFACLYLDNRNCLLMFEEAFRGSINRAYVFPREILRRCLQLNASGLILAHNHPSGVTEPSRADIELTRDLHDLLRRVDVRVLDHIIVARHGTLSLASRGLIPE